MSFRKWALAGACATLFAGHADAAYMPNVVEFSTPLAGVKGYVTPGGTSTLYLDMVQVCTGVCSMPYSKPKPGATAAAQPSTNGTESAACNAITN